MKFHSLTVEGFGAFNQRQTVDFDALADDGLFLISGPTGSGKTTILDAVTFALFGRVPGVRNDAGELRSTYAGPNTPTTVVLEFTADGRRWKVERSPSYDRPKLRGAGTTKEKPRAYLFEQRGRHWKPVADRSRQVGEALAPVIGLTAEQFTKIVLLPQGEFTAFLRADPAEREPLLRKLFGTERFSLVEDWFKQRSHEAGRKLEDIMRHRRDLMKAAADQCLDPLAVPDDPRPAYIDVAAFLSAAQTAVVEHAETAAIAAAAADERVERQNERATALQKAAEKAEKLEEHRRLEAEQENQREAVEAARLELELKRAADRIMPSLREKQKAHQALSKARRQHERAQEELKATLGQVQDLVKSESVTQTAHSAAGSLARSLRQREALEAESRRCREALEAAHEALKKAQAAHTEAAEANTAAQSELAEAPDLDKLEAENRDIAALADTALEAHRRHTELQRLVQNAQAVLLEREDAERDATQHYRKVRDLRLTAIASELARDLHEGHACPVCGSEEHPNPARAAGEENTRDAEERAEQAADQARTALEEARAAASSAQAQLAAAEESAKNAKFTNPDEAREALNKSDAALRHGREAQQKLKATADSAAQRLVAAHERLTIAQQQTDTAGERSAYADSQMAAMSQTHDSVFAPDIRAAGIEVPLTAEAASAAADELSRRMTLIRELRTADENLQRAEGEFSQRAAVYAAELEASAFADDQQLERAAAVDSDQLESVLTASEYRSAKLRENRDSDWFAEAQTLPSAQECQDRAAEATAAAHTCAEQAQQLHQRTAVIADRLRSLKRLLDRFTSESDNERREIDRLNEEVQLSELVRGTAPHSKLPLSSFALLGLFEAVTRSASERLSTMTSGRYRLSVNPGGQRKERKTGLSLVIHDAFSESERDPRSLSGGESFMAALALALGLADTVAETAGGLRLDTLFIDEGFGSLDPDSLDAVLTVLDELRTGGRCLGVISHVESMQRAIPAKIVVDPGAAGSTISTAGLKDSPGASSM